jgi:hypothetical protein
MISFIIHRHLDLRQSSGFESPPSKRVGCNFVEDRITGALRHDRVCNLPARSIDCHDANTVSSDFGALRLIWILGQRSAHCHGWAAGNDNEVTAGELAASGCAAGVARFFTRGFFSTGMAGVAGSSAGICSVTATGF